MFYCYVNLCGNLPRFYLCVPTHRQSIFFSFSFSFYKVVYFVNFVCFSFPYNRFCNSTLNHNNTFKDCCGGNRQWTCYTVEDKAFVGLRFNLSCVIRAVCTVGIMFYESFTTLCRQMLLLFVLGCTILHGMVTLATAT